MPAPRDEVIFDPGGGDGVDIGQTPGLGEIVIPGDFWGPDLGGLPGLDYGGGGGQEADSGGGAPGGGALQPPAPPPPPTEPVAPRPPPAAPEIPEVVVAAPKPAPTPPKPALPIFVPSPDSSGQQFLGTVVAALPRRAPAPRRRPVPRRTKPAPRRTRPQRPSTPRPAPRFTPAQPLPRPSTVPLGARILAPLSGAIAAGVAALLYSPALGPDDEYPGNRPMFPFPALPPGEQPRERPQPSPIYQPGIIGEVTIPAPRAPLAPLPSPLGMPDLLPVGAPVSYLPFPIPGSRPSPMPGLVPTPRPRPVDVPGLPLAIPEIFPLASPLPAPAPAAPRPAPSPSPFPNPLSPQQPELAPSPQQAGCRCPQQSKPKRKQRKDRAVCRKGTYIETAKGLIKQPKETVKCR